MKINYWLFYSIWLPLLVLGLIYPIIPAWLVIIVGIVAYNTREKYFKPASTLDYILVPLLTIVAFITLIIIWTGAIAKVGFFKYYFLVLLTAMLSEADAMLRWIIPSKTFKKNINNKEYKIKLNVIDTITSIILILLSWMIIGGSNGLIVGSIFAFMISFLPNVKFGLKIRTFILILLLILIRILSSFLAGFLGGLF